MCYRVHVSLPPGPETARSARIAGRLVFYHDSGSTSSLLRRTHVCRGTYVCRHFASIDNAPSSRPCARPGLDRAQSVDPLVTVALVLLVLLDLQVLLLLQTSTGSIVLTCDGLSTRESSRKMSSHRTLTPPTASAGPHEHENKEGATRAHLNLALSPLLLRRSLLGLPLGLTALPLGETLQCLPGARVGRLEAVGRLERLLRFRLRLDGRESSLCVGGKQRGVCGGGVCEREVRGSGAAVAWPMKVERSKAGQRVSSQRSQWQWQPQQQHATGGPRGPVAPAWPRCAPQALSGAECPARGRTTRGRAWVDPS